MYIRLSKGKSTKDYIVYLVEGYRTKDGKTKQKIIKSFGYLSNLTKNNPNALEELKAWAKNETNRLKKEKRVSLDIDLCKLQTIDNFPRNYGYVFLERIYNKIGISAFMNAYQEQVKCQYDLNDLLKLMVFSRCLNPTSKKRTYETKGNYFFEFSDFKLEDMYKSLSYFATIKDELTYAMHKGITSAYKRDCSLIFYDVTNYYFESEVLDGLRQKGVSKEKRKTGIVQMGLFIDRNGIPITYELFPGNTNDLSTMKPILEKIKKQYNLGHITIVADKGNNSGKNLDYINQNDDHYIISQKIRMRGSQIAEIVLDQKDYIMNKSGTFKYKTVERIREVKNKTGQVISTIKEHLLCFWSLKEERYQNGKRGLLDETIDRFINNPSLLKASNAFGVKKYFKKITYDKLTGEVIKANNYYQFDHKKYERDIALDGYYAIVTNDLALTPFDIIDKYRQLSIIEDSFRVTKTDLEGRPIYVWTDSHIKGHFLTCFIALTLYRLLQLETDNKYSVDKLKEALNSASTVLLERNIYLLHQTTEVFKDIVGNNASVMHRSYVKKGVFKKELKQIVHNK